MGKRISLIIAASIAGFIIAKIDTSKNWNDTGVTAMLSLLFGFIFGFIKPKFAWLYAIIIGGLIFLFNVIQTHNYGSAGAVLFTLIGAYSGFFFRKLIFSSISK